MLSVANVIRMALLIFGYANDSVWPELSFEHLDCKLLHSAKC